MFGDESKPQCSSPSIEFRCENSKYQSKHARAPVKPKPTTNRSASTMQSKTNEISPGEVSLLLTLTARGTRHANLKTCNKPRVTLQNVRCKRGTPLALIAYDAKGLVEPNTTSGHPLRGTATGVIVHTLESSIDAVRRGRNHNRCPGASLEGLLARGSASAISVALSCRRWTK